MRSLLSSPARLTDPIAVDLFKKIFAQHGALTRRSADTDTPVMYSQEERLAVVPLIFGLMPADALDRHLYRRPPPLKPLIRSHLRAIGLSGDDEDLVDILQNVIYHYTSTLAFPHRSPRAKRSIGEIRLNASKTYQSIRARQRGRCAACGVLFTDDVEETLDHVLPWRLIGDPPNGANWQFLCRPCNSGKQHWMSSIQAPQSFNWWYGCPEQQLTDSGATEEARFVLLTQRQGCELTNCGKGPRETSLHVVKRYETGLAIADNLEVRCEAHLSTY